MNRTDLNRRQIAVVTGGGSGLGFAIAQKFTENDIFTIIIGRSGDKLKAAAETLGENCAFLVADLVKLDAIPKLADDIVGQFGPVDILVNNAGVNMKKDFEEVTDADFSDVMLTNVHAVFSLSREIVRHMLPRKSGCIINISSMAAQYGIPKVIAYTASKSAIEGMTKAMAVELSPKGIRVNAIAPGFIYSAMSAKALDDDPERKAKVFGRTPMGEMGQPEDIGSAALFLAGVGAKYVTGIILRVDGGNAIGF
ncbi:glucose 1-dehydrogenase [Pedobacter sp. HMF7647]|uniref:Glucose 1-dehydrogenase n=1 Tax=Hufsiella arboris TaxID=2695275 RepID=A0A7K1YCR2_9SPHI|nr:SDR family oxidoreductase [Hufsiella arboris]MXV51838.1 glucose 1-dehydrogenase [Hufsiella arboris]